MLWRSEIGGRFRLVREVLAENGIKWTTLWLTLSVFDRLALSLRSPPSARLRLANSLERTTSRLRGAMGRLEEEGNLPGDHAVPLNRWTWERSYVWQDAGEEWTVSAGWKQALVQDVMYAFLPAGGTILEIGPGMGRWTEHLLGHADRLIVVDVSPRCIEVCRERFKEAAHLELHLGDGKTLSFLDDGSINSIWSYDVFVHVSPRDAHGYLREFARVLAPGGRAVIHHPGDDSDRQTRWGSRLTPAVFSELVRQEGLELITQLDGSEPGLALEHCRLRHDVITVFAKPAQTGAEKQRN